MPRIESDYTARFSSTPRAAPDTFYNPQGMDLARRAVEAVSDDAMRYADKVKQVEEVETDLAEAKFLAESRQRWMLDLEDRKMKAEETGSWKGFRDRFDKDYTDWADQSLQSFPEGGRREKMRVKLIEMHTTNLGEASNFEAQKRAQGIRDTVKSIGTGMLVPVIDAEDLDSYFKASYNNRMTMEDLPKQLRGEVEPDVRTTELLRLLELADQPSLLEGVVEDAKRISTTYNRPDVLERVKNAHDSKVLFFKNKAKQNGSDYLKAAQVGILPENWKSDPLLEYLKPGEVGLIEKTNNFNNSLFSMSHQDAIKLERDIEAEIQSEPDVEIRNIKQAQLEDVRVSLNRRAKLLSEDAAGILIERNGVIKDANDRYTMGVENRSDVKELNRLFSARSSLIKQEADRVGLSGFVNLLPKSEVDNLVSEINQSSFVDNSYQKLTSKFAYMREVYGEDMKSVAQQLRLDERVDPMLGVILEENDPNKQAIMLQAMTAVRDKPSLYNKTVEDPSSKANIVISDMFKSGMNERLNDYRATYEMLYKFFSADPNTPASNARAKAEELTFGDLESFDGVVMPQGSNVRDKVMKARQMLESSVDRIRFYMEDLDMYTVSDIRNDPNSFIDFVLNPRGDGVVAKFKNQPNSIVMTTDGSPLEFKFIDIDNIKLQPKSMEKDPKFLPPVGIIAY